MKNKLVIALALLTTIGYSCKNFDLELQENPNNASPDSGDLNAIYNQIQLDFKDIHSILEDQVGEVTRMYNATAANYGAATLPSDFDDLWELVYADLMPDIDALDELAGSSGLNIHLGSAKILKAYVLMALVDVFKDVPLSEIARGRLILDQNLTMAQRFTMQQTDCLTKQSNCLRIRVMSSRP